MSVGFDKPTSKWDQILESEEKKPTFLTVTLELKDKLISNWWALDFLIKFKNKIDWKKLIKKSVGSRQTYFQWDKLLKRISYICNKTF